MGAVPLLSDIRIFTEVMGAGYPRFAEGDVAINPLIDFILRVRSDSEYRGRILKQVDDALDAHKDGYQRCARGVLEFLADTAKTETLAPRTKAAQQASS